MNLSERLELAADRRNRPRPSVQIRTLVRSGLDISDPTIDLRPATESSGPLVDVSDPSEVVEIVLPPTPPPMPTVEHVDDNERGSQWTHGLSSRLLGGGPLERRRERLERRGAKNAEVTGPAHLCPRCGGEARVDIADPGRAQIHLSCDSCFKMWQQPAEESTPLSGGR